MLILKDRAEWLTERGRTIGGSDASAVVGLNPYKTNVELWQEKTGRIIPEDISDKPYVKYGHDAELLLREMFKLDFPQYQVDYVDNNLFRNKKYPWGHYSADGWLTEKIKIDDSTNVITRKGILEIKTTEILQSMQKEKWDKKIPDNYYIQVLHGLLILEADFAVLKAQLKTVFDGVPYLQTKHYHIERADVEADIQYLAKEEEKFWRNVQNGIKPSLILPEI